MATLARRACTADHALLKATPSLWQQLVRIGLQHIEANEDEPAETMELRNCACGSTLAITITTEDK